MMEIIKISNSRLAIVKLLTGYGEKMPRWKYKFFIIQEESKLIFVNSSKSKLPSQSVVYYITETERKEDWLDYTDSQLNDIRNVISGIPGSGYLGLSEKLVLSTRSKEVINLFYQALDLSKFRGEIRTVKLVQSSQKHYPQRYGTHIRYSVYRLLNDLAKDGSSVMIPDYCSDGRKMDDNWREVERIVGNSRRPNLSIKIKGEIIPYTIVRDSLLATDELCVKVSSRLVKKLCRTGCVISPLVRRGEYLLDLTRLPVVSHNELGRVSRLFLAEAAVNRKLAGLAVKFLTDDNAPKGRTKNKDNKVAAEKIPVKVPILQTDVFLGLYYKYKWSTRDLIHNFKTRGTSGFCSIDRFFSSLGPNDLDKWKEKKQEAARIENDMIFRLLMKKTLKFEQAKSPKNVENYTITLPEGYRISWKINQTTVNYGKDKES